MYSIGIFLTFKKKINIMTHNVADYSIWDGEYRMREGAGALDKPTARGPEQP